MGFIVLFLKNDKGKPCMEYYIKKNICGFEGLNIVFYTNLVSAGLWGGTSIAVLTLVQGFSFLWKGWETVFVKHLF